MRKVWLGSLGIALVLAACSPAASPTERPTEPSPTLTVAAEPTSEATEAAAALPAWQMVALRNTATGEPFTFADYAGKTVYVHPMARWCTNCRISQGVLRDEVLPQLAGRDDIVFVSVTIETNDTDSNLQTYAQQNGFPWTFAVATPDLLQQWVSTFGNVITNPPSQPHFVIYPDGTTTGLLTGSPSAADVLALLNA